MPLYNDDIRPFDGGCRVFDAEGFEHYPVKAMDTDTGWLLLVREDVFGNFLVCPNTNQLLTFEKKVPAPLQLVRLGKEGPELFRGKFVYEGCTCPYDNTETKESAQAAGRYPCKVCDRDIWRNPKCFDVNG